MGTPFPTLTPKRWFVYVIGILLFLVIVYLLLHAFLSPGRSKTKLTTADVTIISGLIYDEAILTRPQSLTVRSPTTNASKKDSLEKNKATPPLTTGTVASTATASTVPDGQKPLTEPQRRRVYSYITTTYNLIPDDTLSLKKWIGMFTLPSDLIRSLNDYVFPVRSYFWLYDNSLYVEVWFWTWFGLIASLLYTVSEVLRTSNDAFDKNEVWVHIAKFFYAPLCSLVIFLGLSLAVSDKAVIERIDYSPNQILVAFIMGFFSGRLVQLLQGIKNLIFPDATSPNSTGDVGGQADAGSPLPGGLSSNDIRLAIEQNGDRWRLMYSNVTGIAVQTKASQGQPTGQLAALFEVIQKVPDLTVGQIPATLPFTTPDGRAIAIPTDVVEVGITRLAYSAGSPIHLGLPAPLGASLRGPVINTWGTLGLHLRDSQFDYVLSCYHVLCPDLLAAGIWSFNTPRNHPVFVPGQGGSVSQIGEVVAGRFSQTEDFALVRLTDPRTITNMANGLMSPFFDIVEKPGADFVGSMAFMVGARSNRQQGKVLAPYQKGDYFVPGLPVATMKGLVKTERLATEGDSGAAVFVEENGNNRVLGLLIGYNDEASYVLPISDFCVAFHLNLA